jgi:MFS family permease
MSSRSSSVKAYLVSLRSSKAFILWTLAIASFADTFLYSIVVPVFPTSLVTRAHTKPEDVQSWLSVLLAIYGAALLLTAPIAGYVLDRCTSRKTPFLSGLAFVLAGTAMISVGNSIGLLIAGRLISGASAAIVWTTSAAMIVANIDKAEIGKALGIIALALNLGGVAGPILGGVVYDHGGYHAVFGMAFGVVAVDIVLRIALIERTNTEEPAVQERPDNATVDMSDRRQSLPPSSENREVVVPRERIWRRHLPTGLILLTFPRILITVLGSFAMALLLAAFEAVLPLYVEEEFGFSSTGAGLIFLPLAVPSLVDPLVGRICDRHPQAGRYIAASGFIGAAAPLVLLRLVDHKGIGHIILLCVLLAIIGLGLAMTASPLLIEVNLSVAAIEEKFPGLCGSTGAVAQGFGLFICAFAAGTLVGPLLAGFVREQTDWGTMTWVLGLVSGCIGIPISMWLGGWIGD